MPGTIVIVAEGTQLAEHLARALAHAGAPALTCTARQARAVASRETPEVVVLDLNPDEGDGARLMNEVRAVSPLTQFVVLAPQGSIRFALEATGSGAACYLTKPFEPEAVIVAVQNALKRERIGEEVQRLRSRELGELGPERCASPAMRRTVTLAQRAARQDGIVLLLGESGTGKDHLCRWIHAHSRRKDGPFFSINCAALSRELAESELFGHEPGAFTGTHGRKRGLLELAEKGSLLLNELGELDLALQSKLLTFLDTRTLVRVGGEKSISIDARIFAATNRNLLAEVEAGRFRRDLYYRVNVFPIELPPLRERKEDLPVLVGEILERLGQDGICGTAPLSLTGELLQALESYSWPGNIRELRNVLERALILAGERELRPADLGFDRASPQWRLAVDFPTKKDFHQVLREVARELILEALRRTRTRQQAAKLLGISRHSLHHQMKALKLRE